jgi:hypothetical protein
MCNSLHIATAADCEMAQNPESSSAELQIISIEEVKQVLILMLYTIICLSSPTHCDDDSM